MTETWRPVPGYDGLYEVSDEGNVRSLHGQYGRPGPRPLAQPVSVRGYQAVTMYRNGGQATCKVHNLVAETFIGPRPSGLEVRHLDGNPLNNAVSNLAYGTHSENTLDSVRHGTHPEARKTHCPAGHPYDEKNTRVESRGKRTCWTCKRAQWRAQRAIARRAS